MQVSTNAPAHWPTITVDGWDETHEASNIMAVGSSLVRGFQADGSGEQVTGFMRTRLAEAGVLEIPIEVSHGDVRIPVFVYPTAGPESAAHFAGARRILEAMREARAIYYAPGPLEDTAPGNPLRPFTAEQFSKPGDDPAEGTYAMWWMTASDPKPEESRCIASIDRAMRATDGISSYILAAILRSAQLVRRDVGRVRLPIDGARIALSGPEDRPLLLTASQEKGLRFHFPVSTTPVTYRDRFWNLFAGFAEGWQAKAEGQDILRDETAEDFVSPYDRWKSLRDMLDQPGRKFEAIGVVDY